ncbi:MAG: hypothetical protein LBC77_08660 [Spirochaetaceae bacterium]|jgi:hypothetical protein|nr:hypothetical protein [Spirochaetaceae bacterium]
MDEQTAVLQHLIEIEKTAAIIVEDAEKEAAALIAEGERAAREVYETEFSKEFAVLEAEYNKQVLELTRAYEAELGAQRDAFDRMPHGLDKFAALAGEYLYAGAGREC